MKDGQNRCIDYLRISITDRCNLRCVYCMPQEGVPCISHQDILSFEEIGQIVKAAEKLGVKKIKLTGGEPLVRKNIITLIELLREQTDVEQITLTTNGVLLEKYAKSLQKAGLTAVNISLDTLDPIRYKLITRSAELSHVLEGLEASLSINLPVKINCVPVRELNGDQLVEIAGLGKIYPVAVRFIEMMPIGYGRQFEPVSNDEILKKLEQAYGTGNLSKQTYGNGPAIYYEFAGFQKGIGFISAVSHEFCENCNRIRLTSDGKLKLCLHHKTGIDVRQMIRSGMPIEELTEQMKLAVLQKPISHQFYKDEIDEEETKAMVQIGG